jgi:MFS transporter, ACS family, D-galactonate transporter
MGVAAPRIREDLSLSEIEMGWVMSAFYWAYALSQIPAGTLGQHWGSRRGLAVFMTATSLLCATVALTGGFITLGLVWMGVGMTIAGIFPCCAQSIPKWFPETQRALPSGFLGSSMSIGAAISTALTGWLLATGEASSSEGLQAGFFVTWRGIFVLYALPGLLWAGAFAWWFRNRPSEHPRVNAAELELITGDDRTKTSETGTSESGTTLAETGHAATPWRRILTHPRMMLICAQQFFRAAGYVFYATWFPTYLREVHGVSTAESGYLTSLPLAGVVLGGATAGTVSDFLLKRTGSKRIARQFLGAGSQFLSGTLILLAWLLHDPYQAVALLAVGSFVFSFGGCCAYTVTIDLSRPYVAPVFSTMNMAGNIGAAVCPAVVGWLAVVAGWPPVLLFFASIYFLAGLCWSGLNPNGTLFDEPERPDTL